MSSDLRERLHQAASSPSTPLDVDVVYRRGRRIRRARTITGVAAVAALAILGGTAGLAGLTSVPVPVISNVEDVEELLADGRVSWREYRIAVAATAECLEDAGVDRSHRFDAESGTFAFTAAETPPFLPCRDRHLIEVEDRWVTAISSGEGGVTWDRYRTAHEGLEGCLMDAGLGFGGEFDLSQGSWSTGYFVRADLPQDDADVAEQTFEDCRQAHDIAAVARSWDELTVPSQQEQHKKYQYAVQCMRDLGHDVPDANPDTLSTASRQWPQDYDRCLEQGRAAAHPYLGSHDDPDLADRLVEAQGRWSEANLGSYTFQYHDAAEDRTGTVRVVDGKKVSGSDGFTIDELFGYLQDDSDPSEGVEASFHPQLGYPTHIRVIRDEAAQPFFEATISDLQPLPADGATDAA